MGYNNENENNAFDDIEDAGKQAYNTGKKIYDTAKDINKIRNDIKNHNSFSESVGKSSDSSAVNNTKTPSTASSDAAKKVANQANQTNSSQVTQQVANSSAQGASTGAASSGAAAGAGATAGAASGGAAAGAGATAGAASGGAAAGAGATAGAASGGAAAGAGATAGAASSGAAAGAGATAGAASAGVTAGGAAATAAGAGAAGAATGGVGAIVVVAAAALVALKKGIDKKKEQEENPESNTGSVIAFLAALLIPIAFIIIVTCVLLAPSIVVYNLAVKPVSDTVDIVQQSVESYIAEDVKEDFFQELFGKEYDLTVTSPRDMNEQTVEVYKDIIDFAIYKAFDTYVWNLILDMDTYRVFMFDGYNPVGTYQKFLDNPYPYALARKSDGQFYTVKEFINTYDVDESKRGVLNDDLNYAEIIALLCQSEDNSFNTFSYSDFYDQLVNKRTTELLFEMRVTDKPTYFKFVNDENMAALKAYTNSFSGKYEQKASTYTDTASRVPVSEDELMDMVEDEEHQDDTTDQKKAWYSSLYDTVFQSITSVTEFSAKLLNYAAIWTQKCFFVYDVTVKPYGLEELYAICDTKATSMNPTFTNIRNIDLLDIQEQWLRELLPDIDLGPSYDTPRTARSTIYYDLSYKLGSEDSYTSTSKVASGVGYNVPTGRSAMCYLDDSFVQTVIQGVNYKQSWDLVPITLDLNYNPSGQTVILDMYDYINQGKYPNDKRGKWDGTGTDNRDSIKRSGCIDCSYVMIQEYYYRAGLDVTNISYNYVQNNLFLKDAFCSDFGLSESYGYNANVTDASAQNYGFNETVTQSITEGRPVLFHLQGVWEYGGIKYHASASGHWLVIMGYDETGFYVYDPGSAMNTTRNNGHIPYQAFLYASDKRIRLGYPTHDGATITYKINTIAGIN